MGWGFLLGDILSVATEIASDAAKDFKDSITGDDRVSGKQKWNNHQLSKLQDELKKDEPKPTSETVEKPAPVKEQIKAPITVVNDQFIIACAAIAISTACVDGEMSADERGELNIFLNGLKEQQEQKDFSPAVKEKIQEFEANPPSFMKAKKEVDKVENKDRKIFRLLIENIIRSDNEVSPEEEDLLETWDTFYPETK